MGEMVAADGEPADFWVFGYGSLMWRPGFSCVEVQAARVSGFRRDMCFLSIHYRGTAETPGLVCGLMAEPGAICHGRAFRIAPEAVAEVVATLDARELITRIYLPQALPAVFGDGRQIHARTYIADTAHAQFVGHWSDADKAAAIAAGRGSEGRSLDYLASLVAHLDELNIGDGHLRRLLTMAAET
jgi:cation transport protein ChaC